ncbi:ABC transporter permease [Marinicella meishanensis]|uniref:ABC transporter permease n=1 Tax=Marinicella meishanensis TaxID=2873263 RepID=UPI001CBB6595|nr:ABC transporter permease [Marinicella sp. NBU2979]
MSTPHTTQWSHCSSRINAILRKEFIQMFRDRMTFAMMLAIPLMQLMLFGFAINTDPKHLPTAVYAEDNSPLVRSIIRGLSVSEYYHITHRSSSPQENSDLLARGDVAFAVHVPAGFSDQLIKGLRPPLLIEADASDPSASSNAIGRIQDIINQALRHDLTGPLQHLATSPGPVSVIVHPRYNPEGKSQYNIVPGLLGVILTMTLVMITSMAMTREAETGTLENLLAMPARPIEVMLGKILPYVVIGGVQTGVVLLAAHHVFAVPFIGPLPDLLLGVMLFIVTNLALGFTFSTLARTQMQAMQLTFFFFLPSILLSGFMFPFRGMPGWAQAIGEVLPLTHFLRIIRGIMLKGTDLMDHQPDLLALLAFTTVIGLIAITRYKQTLD